MTRFQSFKKFLDFDFLIISKQRSICYWSPISTIAHHSLHSRSQSWLSWLTSISWIWVLFSSALHHCLDHSHERICLFTNFSPAYRRKLKFRIFEDIRICSIFITTLLTFEIFLQFPILYIRRSYNSSKYSNKFSNMVLPKISNRLDLNFFNWWNSIKSNINVLLCAYI